MVCIEGDCPPATDGASAPAVDGCRAVPLEVRVRLLLLCSDESVGRDASPEPPGPASALATISDSVIAERFARASSDDGPPALLPPARIHCIACCSTATPAECACALVRCAP